MKKDDTDAPDRLMPTTLPALNTTDPLTEDEQEDMQLKASIAYVAVPVILVHLVVIYTFISAMTGFHLPAWLDGGKLVTLLWMNGAIVGTLFWGWKRGGIPINGKIWLRGRSAILLVVIGAILLLAKLLFG